MDTGELPAEEGKASALRRVEPGEVFQVWLAIDSMHV
jgi:hypothetical protein